MGRPTTTMEKPLQPQIVLDPFEKWGIDFVGPIDPPSKEYHYILVCIDYVTKWAKAKSLPVAREEKDVDFLYKQILQRFGALREIVSNQGPQFMSTMMEDFMHRYKMAHRKSSPYHHQANGQVEVTNRELENIITKTVYFRKSDWSDKSDEAVWAYNTTWKTTTGFSPYELVYGKILVMPIEFELTTWDVGIDLSKAMTSRISQLNRLDEMRIDALQHTELIQNQRKLWHDKHIVSRQFKKGDWALLFDSRFQEFKEKIHTRWLGPYQISQVYDNGAVQLVPIDGEKKMMLVNGHRLKLYHKPASKEELYEELQ